MHIAVPDAETGVLSKRSSPKTSAVCLSKMLESEGFEFLLYRRWSIASCAVPN